jgi:hypothetical protein
LRSIDIFQGVFFTAFGLVFLIYNSRMSEFAIRRWHERYPNIKIFKKGYNVMFILVGIAFTAFGILSLLGVIRFRN